MSIEAKLTHINNLIIDFERKYQREAGSVRLLAVSKKQSIKKIEAAYHAGQYSFGENYLQEALPKIAALPFDHIEWHFIGPIQSNKTRKIAENFTWVHSVDSLKIAQRLNDQRPTHLPPLNICLEVKVSTEASKSGICPKDAFFLAKECQQLPQINLRGLMTIPAPFTQFDDQRREFHKLYTLYELLREKNILFDTLSMGMSEDFEAAIAEGSTLVRIGSAIFGKREP